MIETAVSRIPLHTSQDRDARHAGSDGASSFVSVPAPSTTATSVIAATTATAPAIDEQREYSNPAARIINRYPLLDLNNPRRHLHLHHHSHRHHHFSSSETECLPVNASVWLSPADNEGPFAFDRALAAYTSCKPETDGVGTTAVDSGPLLVLELVMI